MRLQHIALALALVAVSASAAAVRLGPEVPLSPEVELEPAPGSFLDLASDGRDFLLVWQDSRMSGPDIYLTRVGSDGRPFAPFGRRLAPGMNPKVAASPAGGYIVVWTTPSGIRSLHVDADGTPLAAPRFLTGPTTDSQALLTNGSTLLLVYLDSPNNRYTALVVDAAGGPLRPTGLTLTGFTAAGVRGRQYVIVGPPQFNGPRAINIVTEDGSVPPVTLPEEVAGPAYSPTAIAFAPHGLLVVSGAGFYSLVGYDGTVLRPRTNLPLLATNREMAAAWDGQRFLAVFSKENAFRIAADGTPVDTVPFSIDAAILSGLKFAANGSTILGAWNQPGRNPGLVGRTMTSFDALAVPTTPVTPLALRGEAQIDPQIARGAKGVFAVWSDSGRYAVYASFNGQPLTVDETETDDWVGWPAIAAGDHTFLVVWRHNAVVGKQQVLARRYDADGHPLDAAPVVLGSYDSGESSRGPAPAIAFNGSTYFVAWNRPQFTYSNSKVYSARIREEGAPYDARETLTAFGAFGSMVAQVRVLSTGTGFVVAYSNNGASMQSFYTPPAALEMIRFDGVSTTSAQSPARSLFSLGGAIAPFSATVANDRITYAWADSVQNGDIYFAQTTLDGTPLRPPQPAFNRTPEEGPSLTGIVWNGSEHVLAWLDAVETESGARKLQALRFDFELRKLDPEPFEIFAEPGPLSPPWLIRTPAGALIAYSRSDAANGNASRVFMRALDRIPQAPHRRAVGR